MARFNAVKLNTIYFTSSGLAGATACKLSVKGLDQFLQTRRASVSRDLNNVPYRQQSNFAGKGFDVEITVEILPQAVFNSINAAINAACENSQTLALEITGDTGTFNLSVIPNAAPIKMSGEFINGRIKQVTYSFVTV